MKFPRFWVKVIANDVQNFIFWGENGRKRAKLCYFLEPERPSEMLKEPHFEGKKGEKGQNGEKGQFWRPNGHQRWKNWGILGEKNDENGQNIDVFVEASANDTQMHEFGGENGPKYPPKIPILGPQRQ